MRISLQTRRISGKGSALPGGSQVRFRWLTTQAISKAMTAPSSAPAVPSNRPSVTNIRRIPERRRPTARKVPISVVRSMTAVFMVLLTVNSTMPPISTKMKPKIASKSCKV